MALDTGYLYKQGTNGQTKTVTSQRNRIYSPHVGQKGLVVVGLLGSFKVSETRKVEPVRGIGFGDQVAELVPGNTDPTKIDVTKTCLYLENLMQVFGYRAGASGLVRSLKHHKWPFDLRQEIVFSELVSDLVKDTGQAQKLTPDNAEGGLNNFGDPGNLQAIFTMFEACWMDNYSYDYGTDNVIVQETGSMTASDVYDGNDSVYGQFIMSGNSNNSADVTGWSSRFAGE